MAKVNEALRESLRIQEEQRAEQKVKAEAQVIEQLKHRLAVAEGAYGAAKLALQEEMKRQGIVEPKPEEPKSE